MAKERSSRLVMTAAFLLGLAVLPIAAALAVLSGRAPADAIAEPPQWESFAGRAALYKSLAMRARGLRDPIPDSDAGELMAGLKLYRMNCAGCHGDYRRPSDWGSRGFYPRVPQFGVEPSPLTSAEAFVVLRDGIRYSGMGAWRDLANERDRWRMAGFVTRLHRLPPEVDTAWKAGPQPTAPPSPS